MEKNRHFVVSIWRALVLFFIAVISCRILRSHEANPVLTRGEQKHDRLIGKKPKEIGSIVANKSRIVTLERSLHTGWHVYIFLPFTFTEIHLGKTFLAQLITSDRIGIPRQLNKETYSRYHCKKTRVPHSSLMPDHSLTERDDRDGNSPSPFANLKQDSSTDGKPIWRTGSLDEGWRKMPAEEHVDENHDKDTSVVTALHSSFDASLFEDERHDSSIFRPTSAGKHARNAEEQDFVAPGTVRKLRRRSDLPPGSKNTPGRHSHNLRTQGSATGTPTSAARRRRGTLQRRSPRHKASAKVPPAATPVIFKFQETASPAVPRTSLFGGTTTQLKHPVLTPTRAGTPGLPYATTAKKTQTCHTATTVNSSFDGMNESHETSSPTPFRFTTFPASLPRVNNPRSTDRNYMFPPSTRKQMAFSAFAVCEEGEVEKASNANSSQEEDVTHNSSLSSLSADAQREVAASSVQPKTLQWKSPEDEEMDYRRNSIDSEVAEQRLGAASPVHARLFADDDEELAASPGQNSKQKLDFHPTASPFKPHGDRREIKYTFGNEKDSDIDLSHPYEQRKTNSFPSTASSTTPLRNISTFEDATIDSGMTPSGGAGGMHMADNTFSPEQQVKFHFHVDATQCSPIPGIPEEEGDVVTRNVPLMAMMDTDGPTSTMEPNISSRQVKERPPRSMPRKRSQRRSGGSHSSWKGSTPSKQDSSKLSLSNESGDGGSSSTSSNQRRLRPMPDMNAFDAGISRSASSSRNDTDESSGNIMTSRAAPPSPQLVCPPTPQRTPAWASYTEQGPQPKYSRQNSLIATKVLATCPTQVLDGHSSLESSLMEDDEEEIVEPSGPLFGRTPSQPFSSVAEDLEEEEDEESPIRELPGLHEMLAAQPSSALMPRLKRHTSAPVGNTVSNACSSRRFDFMFGPSWRDTVSLLARNEAILPRLRPRRDFRQEALAVELVPSFPSLQISTTWESLVAVRLLMFTRCDPRQISSFTQ